MMLRTSEVKLGRSPKAERALSDALRLCASLYNGALQERVSAYRQHGRSTSFYEQCKSLTQIRAAQPEFAALDAQMTRLTALHRLDKAFRGFFARVKRGDRPGFPRYKSWRRFDTIMFETQGWRIDGRRLILRGIPGSPTLRVKGSIHRQGKLKGLRLVRRADRWYAQFIVDVGPALEVREAQRPVGIDVGLKTFATLSTGEQIDNPRFLRDTTDKLAAAQRAVSTKRRGSRRRQKAKLDLQRLHVRIAHRRRDFIRQTVGQLVRKHDGFAVEKLDIQAMAQASSGGTSKAGQRGLHRGIMDAAWGMFFRQLASKAEEAGMRVVAVDPKGTTQRCSGCGTVVRKTLRDRVHKCGACGLELDRDHNAALNIYDLGWRSADASAAAENPV